VLTSSADDAAGPGVGAVPEVQIGGLADQAEFIMRPEDLTRTVHRRLRAGGPPGGRVQSAGALDRKCSARGKKYSLKKEERLYGFRRREQYATCRCSVGPQPEDRLAMARWRRRRQTIGKASQHRVHFSADDLGYADVRV